MVTLLRQCVLWGCLLTAVHLGQCITCRDRQYFFNGECCDLCQPGTRLVNHCTSLTKTQCVLCNSGEYMNTWNRESRCFQHTHCEPNEGLQVKKEGTSDTDTVCACKEGLHCTSKECRRCTLHKSCGPGFGVKQMGLQPRMRALLVIPIVMVILLILIFVAVSFCIKKVVKKPEDNKASPPDEWKGPVEIDTAPVQETLHGCQPVAQEDGKESRISVQERQLTGSMDVKHLV
ncbi:tumor necrosis factor receptor superfamily member 5 isoform X2 [Onychomys torridus]|uniref:tumor necrosis factor receptor superfamily member 5 isoform X2 n=1 Tax=Onychomys torridus TaxID=38674 RepID=UPI00167FC081|nr:tumor necrosis factor receptor superfamily member 5 isoform X2 [Onychomys torridus]